MVKLAVRLLWPVGELTARLTYQFWRCIKKYESGRAIFQGNSSSNRLDLLALINSVDFEEYGAIGLAEAQRWVTREMHLSDRSIRYRQMVADGSKANLTFRKGKVNEAMSFG